MTRLAERYKNEICPILASELGRANRLSLPRLEKIAINMGVGRATQDAKLLERAVEDLTLLAGQRAVVTKAKRSVSNFKVRTGWKIGCRVTLRGQRMYEFLDRLLNATMPRIRDFRGVKTNAFDRQGNYSLGIEEQTIFPEIDPDHTESSQGMDITIVIRNTKDKAESRRLLELLGMPFAR
ncbi:MAG: 50S ribosomal protein L5 [Planctomycetota bacterium]